MPVWVTPKWEGEWEGDPAQVLDAVEGVSTAVLKKQFQVHFTSIDFHWEHGHRNESSVAAARKALLFAERPDRIDALVGFGTEHDEWVRVHAWSATGSLGNEVSVSTHVRDDLDFAKRLVEAARGKIEPPSQSIEPPATAAQAAAPEHVGVVGWLESHQGVIAVVGIVVAVAIAVLLA